MPYRIKEAFSVDGNLLKVEHTLTNLSAVTMRYVFGWHPGFELKGLAEDAVFLPGRIEDFSFDEGYSLETVLDASLGSEEALALPGVQTVSCVDKPSGVGVEVSSKDYRHTSLWTPDANANMFCIEPTTQLPVLDEQDYFESGEFEVLAKGASRKYTLVVKILGLE